MKNIIAIVFILTFFSSASIHAQDPHFSQFFASPLTLNPASTGKFDGQLRLAANHRDQWGSIPKAYVTTSASFDMGILKSKVKEGDILGIGFSGLSDKSGDGALKLNYGAVSLSYHKSLDADGYKTIGAGFQATYSSIVLDPNKLTFEDQLTAGGFTNPTNETFVNGTNKNYFSMNAGVLFSGSTDGINNYYLGASAYHLNSPEMGLLDKKWKLKPRLSLNTGGSTPISPTLTLHASILYQVQNSAQETLIGSSVSAGVGEGNTKVYLGTWYRFGDAIIPYLGLEFGNFRLGSSYDINTSGLKAATLGRGGVELSIIYIKQDNENYKEHSIPCPKF